MRARRSTPRSGAPSTSCAGPIEVLHPSDFLDLPLLHEASTLYWQHWLEYSGVADFPILRGPRLWHAHLTIEAARLGQGVALANTLLVEQDLATGTLVEPERCQARRLLFSRRR